MNILWKLVLNALISGTILAAFLIGVYLLTGNEAYYILFNVDYIPVLKKLHPTIVVQISFHYLFCIGSVVGLYFILLLINRERQLLYYVAVYTLGSAILFSLTALSPDMPAVTDVVAWLYWVIAHAIYGVVVGFFIEYLMQPKKLKL